jgi:hypothetical protein
MTTHRITALALAGAALLGGCTARDFFGYRDDAPMHAIDRPDGYPTVTVGAEIASTYLRADDGSADVMAVSGGRATPTVFYRLSADGELVDVEDPWDDYLLGSNGEASDLGSGAALAGLPTWTDATAGGASLLTGCVAIGEPSIANVHVYCAEDGEELDIPGALSGAADASDFGRALAAIPPIGAASWLLAVASESAVTVFGSASAADRSDPASPTAGGAAVGAIAELAAGVLSDGRFFVAAATTEPESGVPARVHLFAQAAPHATLLEQVACVVRPGEPGFGGSMTAGDLDRDGNDDLIVSAGATAGRVDAVYVYDVAELEAAATACAEDAPAPTATAAPGDGPLDIDCGAGCDFGTALAVGDIATDDDGPELLVGAPGTAVDGKKRAGAVYVFRGAELMAAGAAGAAGRVADSAPEKGQEFGGGVAAAPMAGRMELVAGAVGKGTVFVAYCTGVGADIEAGADVTRNASGKLVSTRCRPR